MMVYVDRVRGASPGTSTSVSLPLPALLCPSIMQREKFAQVLKLSSEFLPHSQHNGRQHSHLGFPLSLAPPGLKPCPSVVAKCGLVVASNQSFYTKISCLELPLLLEVLGILAQMSVNYSAMKQNSPWKGRTDWCGTHSLDRCEGPV